jgi:nucleotide-binding universal stress UspA family protein
MTNSAAKEKILIANDGSQHALKMVEYVSSILDRSRFEVVLYHVVTRVPESFVEFGEKPHAYPYGLVSVEEWEQKQQKAIESFMQKATSILLKAGFDEEAIEVKIEDRKIGIARDIVAESQKGYRALVLGRRGLSNLKDFMLGSVAEHVLGLVPIPMWVVGADTQPGKVLACLDGSEESMLSLAHLTNVLEPGGNIEITLFHAVRGFHSFRNFVREVLSAEADRHAIEKAQSELDQAASMMQPSFEKARQILVSGGIEAARIHEKYARDGAHSAHAIVQEAEEGGYDTILVGRRGHSRVQEFAMGSVSRRVIQLVKDKTVWVV